MIGTNAFMSESYDKVSLAKALEFYETGKATPGMILERFRSLECHFHQYLSHDLKQKKDFTRDYSNELEFIYSHALFDGMSAIMRLRGLNKVGRLHVGEPLLMIKYGVFPIEELFKSEHLDSQDREVLVRARDEKNRYLLPTELLKEKVDELPERTKQLQRMVEDVNELSSEGKRLENSKLFLMLEDSEYDQRVFPKYLKKRED